MMKVEIHTEVINDAYLPYLDNEARTQIYFGGSSSGKSVFLVQRALIDILRSGRNYLVCRQVAMTIRGSVSEEFNKTIISWGLSGLFDINKTDGTITCKNGYQVIFIGLDDVEKIKSKTPAKGVFTDVWIEEATETDEKAVKQLIKRQRGGDEKTKKRLILSFNPILQSHWIYETYFSKIGWAETQKEYITPELLILKTIYKDNRFLTEQDIYDLESETDEYFYNVYTLGNWGVLGNVIFKNWVVADLDDANDEYYLPEEQRTNTRNGLDFGFSSNPAALGVSHYNADRHIIYVYDELYEAGLTNDLLAEKVKNKIGFGLLTCDSAEPKSIAELVSYGVNACGAKKGKDSVHHGIQWLQQQTIIIHKTCVNFINELQQYKWKEDAGGNPLPEPVKRNDHLIDGGLRYAYEDDMIETVSGSVYDPTN